MMSSLTDSRALVHSANNTGKIIQALRKIQFVSEFFVLSKFSESSDYVPEFLMVIEAFKFYFKSIAAAEADGIYIASPALEHQRPEIEALRESTSTVEEEAEREKRFMELIREKPYETEDYHPNMMETFANGKKVQLLTAVSLPKQLKKSSMSIKNYIGEVLNLLRPLISIICIRLFGINSYKSYLISLLIDLSIILVFQRKMKVGSRVEKDEIRERRSEMLTRYIFRKPFFNFMLKYVFAPVLGKIMKPERVLSRLIMSVLEMQSSISLTL